MRITTRRAGWLAFVVLLVAGCAGPPLRIYTLAQPPVNEDTRQLAAEAPVIEVDRLVLPNDIDSEDIVLRDGDVLERRTTGRWASRLSLLATDLVTSRLAARVPDALITDQSPARRPTYRIIIHVAQLDIAKSGRALLDADWQILTGDAGTLPIRDRTRIQLAGPTSTDSDIVRLEAALFDRMADTVVVDLRHAAGIPHVS
ncbi:MAG TPA: ABC-type transport auxiliary lipoprotein family protein [Steroidobacteraceae bacterium]|nr:ABC-type transport auxiliary lipoprotein family protein [Steroidobacteraceae bacterium]